MVVTPKHPQVNTAGTFAAPEAIGAFAFQSFVKQFPAAVAVRLSSAGEQNAAFTCYLFLVPDAPEVTSKWVA